MGGRRVLFVSMPFVSTAPAERLFRHESITMLRGENHLIVERRTARRRDRSAIPPPGWSARDLEGVVVGDEV